MYPEVSETVAFVRSATVLNAERASPDSYWPGDPTDRVSQAELAEV